MLADEVVLEKLETAVKELRLINTKLVAVNANLKILNNTTTPYDWEEEPRPEPPTPSANEKRLMQHIRSMEEENAKLRIMAFDRPRPMYEIMGSDGSNLRFALKVVGIEDCGGRVRIDVQLPSWQKKE